MLQLSAPEDNASALFAKRKALAQIVFILSIFLFLLLSNVMYSNVSLFILGVFIVNNSDFVVL